jgi:hypothetical protein
MEQSGEAGTSDALNHDKPGIRKFYTLLGLADGTGQVA